MQCGVGNEMWGMKESAACRKAWSMKGKIRSLKDRGLGMEDGGWVWRIKYGLKRMECGD